MHTGSDAHAPLTIAFVAAALLAAGLAGAWLHTAWQRRRIGERLAREWGRIRPIQPLDDHHADEAWRHLDADHPDPAGLDDRTWSDLDMDRVLATIDRTHTTLGRQILHRRLRTGAEWRHSETLRAVAVGCGDDPRMREAVGVPLALAGRSLGRGFWRITRPDPVVVARWYWCFPVLTLAMLAGLVLTAFDARALLVVAGLAVLNMGARVAASWQVPGLLTPMQQFGPVIATAERLAAVPGLPASDVDRIRASVRALRPLRRIARWVSRDPVTSGELVAAAWEYLNLLFLLDANALLLSARYLNRCGSVLRDVALWIGDVDLGLAVASLRAEPRPWCMPDWNDTGHTEIIGAWHPLVDTPVANDAVLHAGHGLVITGANMSGKSTYLRAIGIAAVLAGALDTCPAVSWTGRPFRVRSLIGRQDDLSAGKSYYLVEAEGVAALLEDARENTPTLFLLDELLRGTNTVERLAAGEAVLRALLVRPDGSGSPEIGPHVVLVATHDGELVGMLGDLYAPWHFRETVTPDGLHFDYTRRAGAASTRTAIALLETVGVVQAVTDAARRRAERLDLETGRRG